MENSPMPARITKLVPAAFAAAGLLVTFLAASPAFAVPAPKSAAFREWRDRGALRTGVVPAPADLSHLGASYRMGAKRLRSAAIPSRWDSRESGWITPVRDQSSWGTCWAFAAMACLETSFLKETDLAVTNDFSENHLARHDVGFLFGFDDGGNNLIAAALLTAWRDPLYEAQDPYGHPESAAEAPPACHVQDIAWFPARVDAADNDTLKRAIMQYGAVSVSYYHSDSYLNKQTGAYYCSRAYNANHAVTAVGWDDDYAVGNFKTYPRPSSPGAFLIKNSYGADSHTNGYTWISYSDVTFSRIDFAAYPMPEATNNYGRVYSYDPCGFVMDYNVLEAGDELTGEVENWGANVFTSAATGVVEAVGFYALSAGTEYEIRIFRDCADDPSSGILAAEQTGVLANAGYATVRLNTSVDVGALERFAVAIRLVCPGTEYPLPVEQTENGYCTATSNAGESWYSKDGENWRDLRHFDETANFCIKAYTKSGSDGRPPEDPVISTAPEAGAGTVRVRFGESAAFAVALGEGFEDADFRWTYNGAALDASGASFVFAPTAEQHGEGTLACRVTAGDAVGVRSWSVSVFGERRVSTSAALSAALDDAVFGDRIVVAPGTYRGGFFAPSATIEIVSEEGPSHTVIDAGGEACCFDAVYSPMTLLRGFTLRGGYAYYGGGSYCATLADCVVSNCAAWAGGGLFGVAATNCLVVGNTAENTASGAYGSDLFGCTLYGNDAVSCYCVNTIADAAENDFMDAAAGDYRLSPRSRFVDAGDNAAVSSETDIAGLPRVSGPRVDFGCHECRVEREGWQVPSVARGASAAEEKAAVAAALEASGFSGASVSRVETVAQYGALADWAFAHGVSAAEMSSSAVPLVSAALGADGLMELSPDDVSFGGISMGDGGSFAAALSLPGYSAGRVAPQLLSAAVGAVAASSPNGVFSSDGIDVSVAPGGGSVELRVTPHEPQEALFIKATVR